MSPPATRSCQVHSFPVWGQGMSAKRTFAGFVAAVLFAVTGAAQEPLLSSDDSLELFDGRTLEGWVTRDDLDVGQAKWTVEDGVLVGRQGEGKAGGLLTTALPYRNFVFSVETRIDWPFDSGVFLRAGPRDRGLEVTLDWSGDGEIAAVRSGDLLAHNETAKSVFKKDDWNRVTVRCEGADAGLRAWLNGTEVMAFALPPGGSLASTGPIGFQVHGGEDVPDTQAVRFRNVRVRELPEFDPQLFDCDDRGRLAPTAKGHEIGWRALFDGGALDAWETSGGESGVSVKDGLLRFTKEGGGGDLRTKEDFRDFELRLDFRLSTMCNSGLFLRAARDGSNPAYSGCEIQILDDFNWERVTGKELKDFQFTGGLYGSVPNKKRDALRPLGHWNSYEVRYVGSRLAVKLNGETLYDVDTLTVPGKPFGERARTGFIGLQRHAPRAAGPGDFVAFRNLFVRPLP